MRNKEKKKEYDKEYNLKNKDRDKEIAKNYYLKNKNKILNHQKEYRLKNQEIIRKNYKINYNLKYKTNIILYRIKNKKRIKMNQRKRVLLRKYNLTTDQYNMMITKQDNKCAICHREFTGRRPLIPCVDHSHTTNKVRGILCLTCNTALGSLNDSIDNLNNAILYLNIYN